ncbi:RNA polymerase sigma factor [Streptomyces sp. NPDC096013]|uniref:RNA polymerase sigma factor n=1 Tax=Streptomyces sp. NPDC096013 TaxID=3366069 RepID=UPI00382DB823
MTQQVFLGVWRGRGGFRPERCTVGGWIIGIARRTIADTLSARTRRLRLTAAAGASLTLTKPEPVVPTPEAVLDRVLVLGKLARLPAPQRRALRLTHYADLTQTQIARRGLHQLGRRPHDDEPPELYT